MKKASAILLKISKRIETNPTPELYATRAHIYSEKFKDYEKALSDLNVACETIPEKGVKGAQIPFHNRGRLFKKHFRDYENARKDFSTAITIFPNSMSYTQRGILLSRNPFCEFEAAVGDFSHAIELSPEHTVAYKHRGRIYLEELKDYEKALSDFDFVLSKKPEDHATLKNKGIALRQGFTDRLDECYKVFSEAIKLNRYDWKAYFYRGELLEKHFQEYDNALKDYDSAISINSRFTECYIHRANLLQSKHFKDYTGSIQDYLRAIESASSTSVINGEKKKDSNNNSKWVKLAVEKKNRLLRKISRMKKGKSGLCSKCGKKLEDKIEEDEEEEGEEENVNKVTLKKKRIRKKKKGRIVCVVCKMAVYCSEECKKDDWTSHKMNCRSWRACSGKKRKVEAAMGRSGSLLSNKNAQRRRRRRRRRRNVK